MHGQAYTSGDWMVTSGKEDEFIAAWTAFARWANENAAGTISMRLIRDSSNPGHFVSYGEWESEQAVKEWRNTPAFAEEIAKVRAHCDNFQPSDYTLAATPDH